MRDLLRGLTVFAGPLGTFDPGTAPEDPLELFRTWFAEAVAAGVNEPHAMTVATVDTEGVPSARILIMKDLTPEGWWFATTTTSAKGHDLARNANVALLFFWGPQGRQVRVRGRAELADAESRAADFRHRPLEGRVAGLHGRQSEPLAALSEVHRVAEESRERLTADPDLVPEDWGLYLVRPSEVEFWQGDPDRRHTRLRYDREDTGWRRGLLWP
ncbi:pyridoxal 5'-phosphate synthase [Nocardiopsis sp. MG754419]|uniref:pyridoxine/pyridoxamine 5'-phosphate oxidase n=1 Tax=Nocardiopsis sp. MG754419 TaxID=2259865 RepID=UPI001BA816C7|nr:pyridoxal 5'-phosphate synthase [Nocardiopsis sp. MG754419]MBR8741489.1 pyridoxamine 5'-phosphate oxidase [Nocardiopsis sp. MG754419]